MCGRFYVDAEMYAEMKSAVDLVDERIKDNKMGDIYPTGTTGIVLNQGGTSGYHGNITATYDDNQSIKSSGSRLCLTSMKWGFPLLGKNQVVYNARVESVLSKPLFRDSVKYRRCVVPARHYYEWTASKDKITFLRKDNPTLYMAGFYNMSGEEERFILLTTGANESVKNFHHRMPLILEADEMEDWIYGEDLISNFLHRVPPALDSQFDYYQENLFDILNSK